MWTEQGKGPSSAVIVAAVAVAFALVGTAIAGTEGLTEKINKAKVRSIAKKQADRLITSRASGLSVGSAQTAQSAETAEAADSANPVAFAHINANASVDVANSKNISQDNVAAGTIGGYYCFRDLGFTPRGASANIDFNGPAPDALPTVGLGSGSSCPAGTQIFVDTRQPDGTGSLVASFFVVIYR